MNADKFKRKKLFFLFLAIYIIGFVALASIGDKINQDGYIITGLISPLLILLSCIAITVILLKNDFKPKEKKGRKHDSNHAKRL